MSVAEHSRQPRIEPKVTAPELREMGLFGALGDEVLEYLARTLQTKRFNPGDFVFREGEPARDFFVVLDGEVEVTKKSRRGRDLRVAILGPADVFGEMSIIDLQPRSATVQAVAPSRVLRIAGDDMDALYRHDLKAYALIVLNIARGLSRRLRVTDAILADITANVLDEYVVGGRRDR